MSSTNWLGARSGHAARDLGRTGWSGSPPARRTGSAPARARHQPTVCAPGRWSAAMASRTSGRRGRGSLARSPAPRSADAEQGEQKERRDRAEQPGRRTADRATSRPPARSPPPPPRRRARRRRPVDPASVVEPGAEQGRHREAARPRQRRHHEQQGDEQAEERRSSPAASSAARSRAAPAARRRRARSGPAAAAPRHQPRHHRDPRDQPDLRQIHARDIGRGRAQRLQRGDPLPLQPQV